jgi:hypothetical protein
MMNALSLYFSTFLRPTSRTTLDGEKLGYFEVMGISWSLHLIYAFYSVFALYLGVVSYEYLSSSEEFTHLLFQSMTVSYQKFNLMSTLFSVIFYPFIFQFAFKFWSYLLRFYAEIFHYEGERDLDVEIEELLNTVFTANLFLVIPIFGGILSTLTQGYYLFIGLRKKLQFTTTQAFLVLITPLFILFLLTILIASYFMFLFSII